MAGVGEEAGIKNPLNPDPKFRLLVLTVASLVYIQQSPNFILIHAWAGPNNCKISASFIFKLIEKLKTSGEKPKWKHFKDLGKNHFPLCMILLTWLLRYHLSSEIPPLT